MPYLWCGAAAVIASTCSIVRGRRSFCVPLGGSIWSTGLRRIRSSMTARAKTCRRVSITLSMVDLDMPSYCKISSCSSSAVISSMRRLPMTGNRW